MSSPILLLKLLVLLGIANGAPIFARKLLGDRLGMPLDFGVTLPDGQPLFGRSKTFRGLVVSVACTAMAALLLEMDWRMGAALAGSSMLGDLFSSFVKRRLGLKLHARAFALDQVPEALLPLLLSRARLGLSAVDMALLLLGFVVLEVALSRLLFDLGIRDRPY
ncbi:CDP-archaeol synthase [Microvirga thermotolerans]|uniref:CDP-archaeol synthase n=1 Tax=Microvirga thermotolerans TaxID=2651334 RepID=A0A5P9K0K2_9HYPH|nr:CDP-archaeol synthase [Microvirga thermotolerans]QFU17538.1 CDP-archaeol synthase [Microvirga thermotolerans]